jgi:hypothetical protein
MQLDGLMACGLRRASGPLHPDFFMRDTPLSAVYQTTVD